MFGMIRFFFQDIIFEKEWRQVGAWRKKKTKRSRTFCFFAQLPYQLLLPPPNLCQSQIYNHTRAHTNQTVNHTSSGDIT